MNSLRNLLDCVEKKQVGVSTEAFHNGAAFSAIRRSFELAENAMCFDFGDMTGNHGAKVFLELFKLPFPTVWCEFTQEEPEGVRIGFLIHEEHPREWWLVSAFFRLNGNWVIWNNGVAVLDEKQRPATLYWKSPDAKTNEQTTFAFDAAAWGFCAVNCANVIRRKVDAGAKLQKARAKRGKKPLFSYWVLELSGAESGGHRGGGTHASPRLHLRRGHPRQYAPNKWTWVQPCAVGNKALGMVHKDYRLDGLPHNGGAH